MKKLSLFFLLLFLSLSISAQQLNDKFRLADQLLQYIMEGKGEQAHQMLSESLKDKITAAQMGGLWSKLATQVGAYQGKTEWVDAQVPQRTACYCTITFSNLSLRCNASFDNDGRADGINFVPAPSAPQKVQNNKLNEVTIKVTTGGYQMLGILCMPTGKTNVPMVIFASGSGPNDADETIGPNKIFRDIAQGLAENGIASIRFDKRTRVYGKECVPQGEELTLEHEYLQDIHSAIEQAKQVAGIDSKRIFIIGHSQGANVAPFLATQNPELKGIVMLSGNAHPFEDLLVPQMTYLASLDGLTKEDEAELAKLSEQVANVKLINKKKFNPNIALPLNLPASYWKSLMNYNHIKTAKALTCPILIMQGERDYQVTMEDFNLWKKKLGKKNVTFKSYPSLNHLYLESEGKSTPAEYMKPSKVPSYVVTDIAEWVNKQ